MTGKLEDPTLPPGTIVAELGDGRVRRNDGVELEPASRNPWYVLATIAGEQTGDDVGSDLHARNRRYWNGWACAGMNSKERDALARKMGLSPEDLAPLSDEERAEVEKEFTRRLPGAEIPDPNAIVDLSETHFSHTVVWEKCAFRGLARFTHAHFSGLARFTHATFSDHAQFTHATFSDHAEFKHATFSDSAWFTHATFDTAWFYHATFSDTAWFNHATFSGFARFTHATFSGLARFDDATFSGTAWFNRATFSNTAWFDHATFSGIALFARATFSDTARFQSVGFGGKTDFRDARFLKQVPLFYSATLYQNTSFMTGSYHWPKITGATDVDIAEDGKAAYSRLRQMMSELHRPDDEHFFLRQEMDCARVIEPRNRSIWITLYWAFSDYGYGVWRPIFWLLGVWIFPSVAYFFTLPRQACTLPWVTDPERIETLCAGLSALGLSFSNTFVIFGFRGLYYESTYFLNLAGYLKFFGATQTILGFVFLFFLGLGLRNRFRLR